MPSSVFGDGAEKDPLASLCNVEAEQGLLGTLFLNNQAFEHVADVLAPQDFWYPVHGRIYSAIGHLLSQGTPASPITLLKMAEQDPAITSTYLASLAQSAVTVLNAPGYARVICDLARRREIVAAAQDVIADASVVDPERPAETVLDEAEERLFAITARQVGTGGPVRLGVLAAETVSRIEAAYKAGGAYVADTGLADLDRIISGMGAGDLCVLAGRPSMGKSALGGTIAVNAAKTGRHVALFSLEMSRQELSQRWLAGQTGISTDRQRHGQLEQSEWPLLIDAARSLGELPISVDDQARLSVPQIRQRAKRIRRRQGLGLVIIDHLHLIRQGGRQESRRVEIGDATSMLKAVAKELGVPVLLLAQLNRGVEQRENKRPGLADLKESGDIEQDADLVMFLYREEYYLLRNEPRQKPGQTREAYASELADWENRCREVRGVAEIEVAKNRHGRTGMARVLFDAERQRFENLSRGW